MIYKFAILFSIIFIVFVMHLVRKNKLEEKYSILWVIASVVILIVSLFPNLITIIANKFKVYYPPSLMLLFAIIILLFTICFSKDSIHSSKYFDSLYAHITNV